MQKETIKEIDDLDSLYDTVNSIYTIKNPISRLLYVAKIKEPLGSKDDKIVRESTIATFREEVKSQIKKLDSESNLMIIFIGIGYAFIAIENSNENLIKYLSNLHADMKKEIGYHTTVNIISFIEECPSPCFPKWYKFEAPVYEKDSAIYKDKLLYEKGWVLYENLFCNFGRILRNHIHSEGDFEKSLSVIQPEEVKYVKYLPTMDEIREFTGQNYINLDRFIKMYVDTLEVEFDDDIIYPYYWPLNV